MLTVTEGMFGLEPWLAHPNFWSLTTTMGFVWFSSKESDPCQFFGHPVQFSRPRVGEIVAAESFAKYLACQFWQGWLGRDPNSPRKSADGPRPQSITPTGRLRVAREHLFSFSSSSSFSPFPFLPFLFHFLNLTYITRKLNKYFSTSTKSSCNMKIAGTSKINLLLKKNFKSLIVRDKSKEIHPKKTLNLTMDLRRYKL
jgi:hypothetical protein